MLLQKELLVAAGLGDLLERVLILGFFDGALLVDGHGRKVVG